MIHWQIINDLKYFQNWLSDFADLRLIIPSQRSCGKVMFSQMSFCHSVQGVPHVTVGHDALDFTLQGPPTSPDMGLGTLSGPAPQSWDIRSTPC